MAQSQIKPIYFSKKKNCYYFNSISVLGDYRMVKVYNGEKLKGGEIKIDKNGRKYIIGYVEEVLGKNGYTYYVCTGFVENKDESAE